VAEITERAMSEMVNWVGTWVQTDRAGHEAFSRLVVTKPRAASVMHMLIAHMGENNAVVISQKNLARLCDCHVNTLAKALKELQLDRWIEVVQVGGTGTINAYVINDRVAWYGPRDGIRHSRFSATLVAASDDQPPEVLDDQRPRLRQIPRLQPGERQLPTGAGEPPPSSPEIPGLERDLPSLHQEPPSDEPKAIGDVIGHISLPRSGEDDER